MATEEKQENQHLQNIIEAIHQQDIPQLKKLLKQQSKEMSIEERGQLLLHLLAIQNQEIKPETMKVLLAVMPQPQSVAAEDPGNGYAKYLNMTLLKAVGRGNLEIVKLLLTAGADVNAKAGDGRSCLDISVMDDCAEQPKILKALLKRNPALMLTEQALLGAQQVGNNVASQILYEQTLPGVTPAARENMRVTVRRGRLLDAIQKNDGEAVKTLVKLETHVPVVETAWYESDDDIRYKKESADIKGARILMDMLLPLKDEEDFLTSALKKGVNPGILGAILDSFPGLISSLKCFVMSNILLDFPLVRGSYADKHYYGLSLLRSQVIEIIKDGLLEPNPTAEHLEKTRIFFQHILNIKQIRGCDQAYFDTIGEVLDALAYSHLDAAAKIRVIQALFPPENFLKEPLLIEVMNGDRHLPATMMLLSDEGFLKVRIENPGIPTKRDLSINFYHYVRCIKFWDETITIAEDFVAWLCWLTEHEKSLARSRGGAAAGLMFQLLLGWITGQYEKSCEGSPEKERYAQLPQLLIDQITEQYEKSSEKDLKNRLYAQILRQFFKGIYETIEENTTLPSRMTPLVIDYLGGGDFFSRPRNRQQAEVVEEQKEEEDTSNNARAAAAPLRII